MITWRKNSTKKSKIKKQNKKQHQAVTAQENKKTRSAKGKAVDVATEQPTCDKDKAVQWKNMLVTNRHKRNMQED